MPGRAYVSSVAPILGSDNVFKVKLVIVGEKYENALELVQQNGKLRALSQSQNHRPNAMVKDRQSGATQQFEIEIETAYMPAEPGGVAKRQGRHVNA